MKEESRINSRESRSQFGSPPLEWGRIVGGLSPAPRRVSRCVKSPPKVGEGEENVPRLSPKLAKRLSFGGVSLKDEQRVVLAG